MYQFSSVQLLSCVQLFVTPCIAAHHASLYMYIYIKKFKRFAQEVWGVNPEGKTDEQVAEEGLVAMEDWMKKLGVALNISELGATEDMIDGIAEGTFILEGGYKVLTKDEVKDILRASL